MDKVLTYKDEVIQAMTMLAQEPNSIFLGQTTLYPGSVISDTLLEVSRDKLMELPVAEEMQMGIAIGLSLEGYLPICIYPRIDFLLLACNQLVNHLDVMRELTNGEHKAKVIIRTIVGATEPMYPGIQHCQDHTRAFRALLKNIMVAELTSPEQVMPMYQYSLNSNLSTLVVEKAELYGMA